MSLWRYLAFLVISTEMLWKKLLNLFSKVNAPLDPSNVEYCHRLKLTNNAPQKVIVKLLKLKDAYRVLKAKYSLLELEYLLPPLYLSTKVCAGIMNFYGPIVRNFG